MIIRLANGGEVFSRLFLDSVIVQINCKIRPKLQHFKNNLHHECGLPKTTHKKQKIGIINNNSQLNHTGSARRLSADCHVRPQQKTQMQGK